MRLEGRVERPQIGHERERIVAFVGAEREAPRARRTIIAFSGLALREPLASVRSAATTSRWGPPSARASMSIFIQLSPSFWDLVDSRTPQHQSLGKILSSRRFLNGFSSTSAAASRW